jgi:hypothetical protein
MPASLNKEAVQKALPRLKLIFGENPTVDEVVDKVLQPHEVNLRCLKSVKMPA